MSFDMQEKFNSMHIDLFINYSTMEPLIINYLIIIKLIIF